MNKHKCNCEQKINAAPKLLLSYTYFLDDQNKVYISVGHSPENFKSQVVFSKKTNQKVFDSDDWLNGIYTFKESIVEYFNDETVTDSIKENSFELVCVGGVKKLMIKCGRKKFIEIYKTEWCKLYELASFINSIVDFQQNVVLEVENYYRMYLKKCVEKNSVTLQHTDYFTLSHIDYNSFNYSRLFHEIPSLCKSKLIADYFEEVCKYLT